MAPSTTTVVVVVPPRPEPHKGYYSLGRTRPGKGVFFPSGQTEIDVTAEELAELKEEATSKKVMDNSVEGGFRMAPGFLTVIELDPVTAARRRAAAEAEAAKQADDEAEALLAKAEERKKAAKKAAETAAALEQAAEADEKRKK